MKFNIGALALAVGGAIFAWLYNWLSTFFRPAA